MAKKPALVGLTPDEIQALATLQTELLQELPNTFEHFCAQIVSRLLNVPVHVASAGFQFGADGGTSGLKGRRLRVECKRYEESTWTNARSLAGQVEQAGNFDPALEAWVLLTTKTVSETDRSTLNAAGEARGIPVIVIDWSARTTKLPGLAALCAGNPDIVKAFYGDKAEGAAMQLTRTALADVQSLRDDLQPWAIGFKELRSRSLERLQDLWGKANEALALLNQNAAGGASGVLVHRKGPTDALDNWFLLSEPCKPAAVCGPEGHGKTWAALDWLIERQDAMPIVLPIPSHSMSVAGGVDEDAFLNHIARFLRGVVQSGPLELQYWRRRVDRLLARPQTEDPAFLLVFDGLNQNPTFPWANIARIAQGETCRRGVRIVFTVRTSYLEKQREFQPLTWGVTKVPVGQSRWASTG